MQTVLIAANPLSGSKNRFELVAELEHLVRSMGFHCEVITQLDELSLRAREIHGDQALRAVVAAGGDGTISAVAERTPANVPIRILPLGSENLLANYLSISRLPDDCAKAIERNRVQQMDGMNIGGRLAFVLASVGFDAEVVRRVHQNRRSHITRWAYRNSALAAWLFYGWPKFTIQVRRPMHDGDRIAEAQETIEGTGQWCFVFNVPRYATGLSLIPDSNPSDGLLNIGFFERSGRIRGLFQYLSVLRGSHRTSRNWKEYLGTEVHLTPQQADRTLSIQYDGDWGSALPQSIRVVPNRLTLLL